MAKDFSGLKPGDCITRLIGGSVKMLMRVVNNSNGIISTVAIRENGQIDSPPGAIWTFDVQTGVEEDEDLRWGVKFGRTGSCLMLP